MTILVCDDDKEIVDAIEIYLIQEGYQVVKAYDGEQALDMLRTKKIDLMVIDVMMPKLDGIRATFQARKTSSIPIIILSAKTEDADKILGLNVGADDYVTKPFGSEELVARVRSALRTVLYQAHDSELPTGKFQTGDLLIDYEARRVFIGDEEIKLTQTEYNIVDLLSRHPGKMLTYSFIVKEVWGYNDMGSTKRLQVNMANIRKKFGVKPGKKSFIINELGVGYRMCDDERQIIE